MQPTAFSRSVLSAALCALLLANGFGLQAQTPAPYAAGYAAPLTVDRGAAAVWQSLQELKTRASLIMVVAHPDDEDGGMLAYESRDQGVDTTLLTLNRGEGGQNVMSPDYWDKLGEVRTQELLAAGDAYGVHQYFSRVADFGFSKSLDEALKTWGHDRVLYDVVRVVRMTRPLVVTSVFAGNVSDGHGHHQVSGEMAQEVFNAAADPKMFPEQIKAGLLPWAPLKVYARVPFARVTEKGIYDYATGHWEPVRFRNYTNGTWIEGVPTATLEVPEGKYNALFGRSYITVAREGLAQQKSQNGGIGVPAIRPTPSPYHLYASRLGGVLPEHEEGFFDGIDTTLAGIATYAPASAQGEWRAKLMELSATVDAAIAGFDPLHPAKSAAMLAKGLSQTNALVAAVGASSLPADAKYNMQHELGVKQQQFNKALGKALGLDVLAYVIGAGGPARSGPMGDTSTVPTSQTVIPGEHFNVNVHLADQGSEPLQVDSVTLASHAGDGWAFETKKGIGGTVAAGDAADQLIAVTVPANAELTKPYFTRPNIEQSYYDINVPKDLGLPTTPYPLTAEVGYSYAGVAATLTGVVQAIHRYNGPGAVQEPLLLAPAISVVLSPEAGIVPLDHASLHLQVTVHSSVKGPAAGTVHLQLPPQWTAMPASQPFSTLNDGDDQQLTFEVTPSAVKAQQYNITAVAEYNGQSYKQGFENTGYQPLRPYPYYRDASFRTTGVDVKVAPNLKVAYIAGTGDDVPSTLENLGIHVTFLSPQDVAAGDLSGYDAVVLGIRTYAARPELKTYNSRLLEYVHGGGTLIVQYQSPEFDHNYGPYPLSVSGASENNVVEETSKVTLTAGDPLLQWPNKITEADFDGWVEERGHGFARSWDPRFIAPTEMHDAGQEPQRGGLLYAAYGKGTYIYLSYAFFREMPDGVPGSFRIMANLLSVGKNAGSRK